MTLHYGTAFAVLLICSLTGLGSSWEFFLCSEVKERMKKQKQDKASTRAAEAKKAGGKAAKAVPRAGAKAAANFKR